MPVRKGQVVVTRGGARKTSRRPTGGLDPSPRRAPDSNSSSWVSVPRHARLPALATLTSRAKQ